MKDMNSTGQLRDIPEDLISNTLNGQQININIHLIDFIGSIPLIIYGLTNIVCLFKGLECVSILNKTFIIGSLLAVFKGIFDLVTIIPDSNGYANCKNRLGPDSIHFLNELNFKNNLIKSLNRLLWVEIVGINHTRMRYCSDMLLSGHTYFVVLFSLGSYNNLNIIFPNLNQLTRVCMKYIIILFVIVELMIILVSKFHYTVDVLLAIILTLSLWDSKIVNRIAYIWTSGFEWYTEDWHYTNITNKHVASQTYHLSFNYNKVKSDIYDYHVLIL
jgi:hypothetical protein